jgi:hypothetical protein
MGKAKRLRKIRSGNKRLRKQAKALCGVFGVALEAFRIAVSAQRHKPVHFATGGIVGACDGEERVLVGAYTPENDREHVIITNGERLCSESSLSELTRKIEALK